MKIANLMANLPASLGEELVEPLLETEDLRLERIVSAGHVTPPGQWYDQERDEWVLLLSGRARLRFAEPASACELRPGDCLLIPAHCRHRVEWTDPGVKTVWLTLHFRPVRATG